MKTQSIVAVLGAGFVGLASAAIPSCASPALSKALRDFPPANYGCTISRYNCFCEIPDIQWQFYKIANTDCPTPEDAQGALDFATDLCTELKYTITIPTSDPAGSASTTTTPSTEPTVPPTTQPTTTEPSTTESSTTESTEPPTTSPTDESTTAPTTAPSTSSAAPTTTAPPKTTTTSPNSFVTSKTGSRKPTKSSDGTADCPEATKTPEGEECSCGEGEGKGDSGSHGSGGHGSPTYPAGSKPSKPVVVSMAGGKDIVSVISVAAAAGFALFQLM